MAAFGGLERLRTNLACVREHVGEACRRAGRRDIDVTLVAVTKYVAVDAIRGLLELGVTDIGESRPQQLVARAAELAAAADALPGAPIWHLIGHLQRNKIKLLLPHARMIHSLDSERLAEALHEQALGAAQSVDAFLEVNVAGERSKSGIAPELAAPLAEAIRRWPTIRLRGLMTMAPYDPDPETSRPFFARLRELLASLRQAGAVAPECIGLSMGMSQDYAIAVEEGATHIRVGSALFEGLPSSDPRE
jgi:PLP dependent protein